MAKRTYTTSLWSGDDSLWSGVCTVTRLLCIAKVETNQPDYVSFLFFRYGFTQLSPVNWRTRTILYVNHTKQQTLWSGNLYYVTNDSDRSVMNKRGLIKHDNISIDGPGEVTKQVNAN